jgi:periplasmic protein TonB
MPDQSPRGGASREANDHLSRILVADLEQPWFYSFLRNLKETINPSKLPPLQLTSAPVAVADIWGLYGRQKKSWALSTGLQVGIVAALTIFGASKPGQQMVRRAATIFLPLAVAAPELSPAQERYGGGGGARDTLPASYGKLPKAALRQFTPPAAVLENMNPRLAMEPTIIAPPDAALPLVISQNYGDPFGKLGPLSGGRGSGGGIGDGQNGGVGKGRGPGAGPGDETGFGVRVFHAGNGVSAPTLIRKVEPEYSDEARKAKWAGIVELLIEVGPDGRARNIQVQRTLGMGLDEKAVEAVKKWLFKPGMQDGKPVTVKAAVEVNFRLL